MKRRTGKRQTRVVTISINAPVTATVEVTRALPDDPDDEPGDWTITGIQRVDCDLSARGAMECMGDDELTELERLANAARDEED